MQEQEEQTAKMIINLHVSQLEGRKNKTKSVTTNWPITNIMINPPINQNQDRINTLFEN